MERLTERNADGSVKYAKGCYSGCEYLTCSMEEGYQCNHQCEADIVCKLADYEDAEEQGLLLRLPVAIGQTVYTNHSMQGWYCRSSKRPYEAEVVYIGLNHCEESGGGYINISFKGKKGYMLSFTFREIGITWFLTKEEAEQALINS